MKSPKGTIIKPNNQGDPYQQGYQYIPTLQINLARDPYQQQAPSYGGNPYANQWNQVN
jgi:hypothetical protein